MKRIIVLMAAFALALGGCDTEEDGGDGGAGGEQVDASGPGGAGGAGGVGAAGGEGGAGAAGGAGGQGGAGAEGGQGGQGAEGGAGGEGGAGAAGGEGGAGGAGAAGGAGGEGGAGAAGGEGGAGGMEPTCDQPDAASCEAAACIWTNMGCQAREEVHECWRFNMQVCTTRDNCRWVGDHCEPAPGDLECPDLGAADCGNRDDCAWANDACIDRPEGECQGLDERSCSARNDCEAIYADDDCICAEPDPGCAEGDPDCAQRPAPPCACANPYEGCEPRGEQRCEDVPVDACERTNGCHIEELWPPCAPPEPCECPPGEDCLCEEQICEPIPVCVPDEPGACADRSPDRCDFDGQCHVEQREECNGDPRAEELPQPEREQARLIAPPECQLVDHCVENEPEGCDGVPLEQCNDAPGCELQERQRCDCNGGGAVPPEDPNGRPAPPPPEECFCEFERFCAETPECEDFRDFNMCVQQPECQWARMDECICEGAPPPPPNCDPNDANCAEPDPLPPECICEGCVPNDAAQCGDNFDQFSCNNAGCEWIPEDPNGGCECFVDENGREICECADALIIAPEPGQCVEPQPEPQCGDFWNEAQCIDNGCAWTPNEPPPGPVCQCEIDEQGNEVCVCQERLIAAPEGVCSDEGAQPDPEPQPEPGPERQ